MLFFVLNSDSCSVFPRILRSDGELKIDRLLLQQNWEKSLETINGGAGSGSGRGELRIRANGCSL